MTVIVLSTRTVSVEWGSDSLVEAGLRAGRGEVETVNRRPRSFKGSRDGRQHLGGCDDVEVVRAPACVCLCLCAAREIHFRCWHLRQNSYAQVVLSVGNEEM